MTREANDGLYDLEGLARRIYARCVLAAYSRYGRRRRMRNSRRGCARPDLTWSKIPCAPRARKAARGISSGPRQGAISACPCPRRIATEALSDGLTAPRRHFMDPAISSLIDRAGLDKAKVGKLIARGLDGADDGELFLEYRQSEVLVFDNGRLKQATYDTAQGFGLRAVKDEAVGYAHASDVSEGGDRARRRAVRAVKGGYSRHATPRRPAAPTASSMATTIRSATPAFDAKVKLLEEIDAYARAKDPRVRQVIGEHRRDLAGGRDPARRRRDLSRHAPAGARQRLGRRRRRRPAGNRQLRLSAAARAISASSRPASLAGRGRRGRAPGAGQSRSGAGAGRRDGRRARPRLAGRHAARGGRPRARRRLQPQEDLGLRRPDGPAGRRQGRHRRRRRHHRSSAAARSPSTTKARRPTAPC